jgi:2-oxoglutarate dehydrogenase E2 component (dihydrolipoamide succinyltransferase)
MATDVLMPQMGESIAEGTIVRWIKKVGDTIDRDEPLFEISTDKVDAEIPSPGAGVLLEVRVNEGETVPVNSVVAVIGAPDDVRSTPAPTSQADGTTSASPSAANGDPAAVPPTVSVAQPETVEDIRRTRSSPVVRRIARDHHVNISQLTGTGIGGRVTKRDILTHIERGRTADVPAARAPRRPAVAPAGDAVRVEKMSVMRKKIAEHMVLSVRTSPHAYAVYEVDFHRVERLRRDKKGTYEQAGAKLTYTSFVAKAVVESIHEFPFVNASLDGENVVYKRDVNLGIAVALDAGLIVPVIPDAGRKDLLALSKSIQDLAHRARSKQLKPEEVQGGTFTITNPGVFGALFGLPILNQPQVAILAVGTIDKRVVVVDDMMAVHPMCYLSLGFDHRLIDGAEAGKFLQAVKQRLEQFDDAWV